MSRRPRLGMARSAALLWLGAFAAGAADAETASVEAPDGRAALTASASGGPNGGSAEASGRAGAFGFENAVSAGPNGGSIANPPFYGEVGTGGNRYEELFGPPVAHATLGSGGLTAGIDGTARLTVLGWPGPGGYDHVNFATLTRRYPNAGAPENAGSFGGVVATTAEGPRASWLHPAFGWRTLEQRWESWDADTLLTVLENPELGLRATVTDVVDPAEDLLARNFRFERLAGSPANSLAFAHYANLNPTTSRLPRAPSVTDAAADDLSDFATVYDANRAILIHFRPYAIDPASATRPATSRPDLARTVDAIAGSFGPGVYVAIGGQGRPASHQAGLEAAGLARAEAAGTPLLDPFYDLLDDGRLSGSDLAFGKTAGALAGIPPDRDGSFTVYLAAASDPGRAEAIVERARLRGFQEIREDSERDWRRWISSARLPAVAGGADERTLEVAARALMLVRTAQDRETGAILANVTTQTPYRQDWVRDGAFFDYALLLAGKADEAIRHSLFYLGVRRPGGTWDSFYFPDGAEAGFVYPYEVDSQAFALWALWLPYELGAAGPEYLASVWPAIRETADALLLCRDPANGLQCRAPEDDNPVPTQGTQGASTVYLALRSAAAAARAADPPDPEAEARWEERAAELRRAALARLCAGGSCGSGRGGIYIVWPSRLLEGTAMVQSQLAPYASSLDLWSSFSAPPVGGYFQYPMEPILALAPFWQAADRESRLASWIRWLARDLAEPGVLHYGERIFRCEGDAEYCPGGRRYLHAVGFPHVWSGIEVYLAAAFVHGLEGTSGAPCPQSGRIGEAACATEPP